MKLVYCGLVMFLLHRGNLNSGDSEVLIVSPYVSGMWMNQPVCGPLSLHPSFSLLSLSLHLSDNQFSSLSLSLLPLPCLSLTPFLPSTLFLVICLSEWASLLLGKTSLVVGAGTLWAAASLFALPWMADLRIKISVLCVCVWARRIESICMYICLNFMAYWMPGMLWLQLAATLVRGNPSTRLCM